jgi:hypothetical protein
MKRNLNLLRKRIRGFRIYSGCFPKTRLAIALNLSISAFSKSEHFS